LISAASSTPRYSFTFLEIHGTIVFSIILF
jgi:hypothetical protein